MLARLRRKEVTILARISDFISLEREMFVARLTHFPDEGAKKLLKVLGIQKVEFSFTMEQVN